METEGRKLSQSGVILTHLSQTTGKFAPADENERMEALRWMLFDNHKFTSYLATYRFLKAFAQPAPDANVLAFLKGRFDAAAAIVDKHLAKSKFMVGDKPTTADFSLAGYVYYPVEEHGYDWAKTPPQHPRLDRAAARAPRLEGPLRADAGRAHQARQVSARSIHPRLLATGGLIAIAAAIGIGRFIYTPILPPMAEGLHLTKGEAGLIASANFLGYLAGALAAASPRLPGGPRAWLLAALATSAATTGAMAWPDGMAAFLALRFIGGVASAYVLVLASALVLERLNAVGHGGLSAVHFSGVGTGIVVSALLTWALALCGHGLASHVARGRAPGARGIARGRRIGAGGAGSFRTAGGG